MIDEYKNSELWKQSLGQEDTQYKEQIELLRSAYLQMRGKVKLLTSHIKDSVPGLTIHDVTHLDALWETADLLAGDNITLNPLEGFVFGAAVLLHDSGLCFEAYEGGKDGLRATTCWKDSKAHEVKREPTPSDEEADGNADFAALRALHAEKAKELATKKWTSSNGPDIYLIEDPDLLECCGELIGEIASSHHWDIEKIEYKFSGQKNPLPTFPDDWVVDPLKIACLLRCADAAHIDSRRAPAFLYALSRRAGISDTHWKGQSLLDLACPDQDDDSLVVYTSKRSFTKDEAAAWWVVYDAITLIDKEIKSSNDLLKKSKKKEMRVKAVKGANDPKQLSKYIKAKDWTPSPISIHVSNLENLIKKLGGEKLYGSDNKLVVALRELIQNARDAVAARRELDKRYDGRIEIEIEKDADGNAWVSVSDDGIGMSERVLTQVLLDFGTSFWISDLVCEEHPGLRSSSFRSVGQFGIGFYSIFMVAEEVTIYTKRWDEGLEETRRLYFPKGLSLRPVFSTGKVNELPVSMSTKVKFKLKSDIDSDKIQEDSFSFFVGGSGILIGDYIKRLVASLDVQLNFKGIGDPCLQLVHDTIENICADPGKIKAWLQDISLSKYSRNQDQINIVIDSSLSRMRPLLREGVQYGFAALPSLDTVFMNLEHRTIGGLGSLGYSYRSSYVGYMEHAVDTARRNIGKCCLTQGDVDMWVSDQIRMLNSESINHHGWVVITEHVYNLGSDPIGILHISLKDQGVGCAKNDIFTLSKLLTLLKKNPLIICGSEEYKTYEDIGGIYGCEVDNSLKTFWLASDDGFSNLELNTGDEPVNYRSFIDCLWRFADIEGYKAVFIGDEMDDGYGKKLHILQINLEEKKIK